MKNILVFIFLIISIAGFSQNPSNYQYRTVRERLIAMMVDSSFHIPRYNGVPSGLRVGSAYHDGALAADTANHNLYFWSNSVWTRMAKYSDITASSANLPIRITGGVISADTSVAFVPSLTTNARLKKVTDSLAGATATPTLQQVFNTEVGGSVLTKTDTIDVDANELVIRQPSVFTVRFNSSGSGVHSTSANNVGVYGISQDDVAGVVGENSSTITGSVQSLKNISNTHLATPGVDIYRTTTGTALNGIGSKIRFITETSTGAQDTANKIESIWNNATHASRESWLNIYGVDNTTQETFMNIQKDLVRINNNADTLATLQDVRDGGGGGGVSAADLPLRVTGSTVSADTSTAFVPSLTTNARLQKIIDSLNAAGWGNTSFSERYSTFEDIRQIDRGALDYSSSGTGSTTLVNLIGATNVFPGWIGSYEAGTGTTSSGYSVINYGRSGNLEPVVIDSAIRLNVGFKIRLEDLSDGTETFNIVSGMGDISTTESTIVDGVWFYYTNADSSGQWVCKTRSNSSTSAVASGVTVAADTDYVLETTVYNGVAQFYISTGLTGARTLVGTISSNVPNGAARHTAITTRIIKSAGTTSRVMYVDWGAFGTTKN